MPEPQSWKAARLATIISQDDPQLPDQDPDPTPDPDDDPPPISSGYEIA